MLPATAAGIQAEAAPQVPAVYLPPFYQAERSLARALLRLHAARAGKLSAFAAVDWDRALAGGRPERRYGGRVFRVGDKVTQLRSNYGEGAAGVFNGTVGVVTALSPEDHAVTIHRSQGSEYPAVVIPLTTSS